MSNEKFTAHVAEGRRSVKISFEKNEIELTTQGVEELIVVLSDLRAKMMPEVSDERPVKFNYLHMSKFAIIGDKPSGGAFIGFRHPGLGWLHFHLQHSEAADFARNLQKLNMPTPPKTKH